MVETKSESQNDVTPNSLPMRKRRLSKKEQKELKKLKRSQQSKNQGTCTNEKPKNEENESYDYLQNFKPIELPVALFNSKEQVEEKKSDTSAGKDLGKWFPTAKIIKPNQKGSNNKGNQDSNSCSILLFYQYASPQWPKDKVDLLISYLVRVGEARGLGGRIRVATEGVNATISCVGKSNSGDSDQRHGCENIRHFAEDLRRFDPVVFAKTDFKYLDHLPVDRHFKDFKILPVQELVFYGIQEKDAPLSNGGVHLPPKEYHEKLGNKGCVVIDVRNHYEAAIGRFEGQMKPKSTSSDNATTSSSEKNEGENSLEQGKTGAEYIDPLMRKSTDFTSWLDKKETQDKLKGKDVLMYCTGGVRCERASAYLKTQLGEKLQLKGVYQLEGGIEKYLQEFPDGGYWKGKNFVFDKREAISAENPNGDGGVVRKKKKNDKDSSEVDGGAECCCCGKHWDRYIGKKKCFTCGVPVLMCDKCMSKKTDKTPGMELSVRCPLCKKEGITVPANDVEYTENGKKSKEKVESNEDIKGKEQKKAAASVLKWGGGHATQKKEIRKLKRKKCRFGAECVRKDCFFAH